MISDLERVIRMAIKCGIYRPDTTLLSASPRALLAFEQAALAKQSAEIESLKAKLAERMKASSGDRPQDLRAQSLLFGE